jgi:hypothetical protein
MEAAQDVWSRETPNAPKSSLATNVVVTTESKQVMNELAKYATEVSSHNSYNDSFLRVRFVTNHFDVTQDTGYFDSTNTKKTQHTANEIMLSSISSLKLQLYTRITVGNCCSNFHLLLKDLLSVGCGSSPIHTFQCLQTHANPTFRVCCSWDKSEECQARRQATVIQADNE